jgi:hypothetical protein
MELFVSRQLQTGFCSRMTVDWLFSTGSGCWLMCLGSFQSVWAVISSGGAIVISIPSSMLAAVWVAVFGSVWDPIQNRLQPITQRRMMRGRSIIMKTRFRIFFSSAEVLGLGYSFCEFGVCILD